uniref:Zinc finger, CCHC-type n=1 Tax=Tanacetum cinerariifolium TaxID=118510 RepID=A0A699HUG1_TANCI|nr:zinc finger, CCHC-type [Tanacetum cinerariifolium]
MMTGTKFDIEKFDGKNDFALWQNRLYNFNMHPGKSQSEHIDEFHKLVGDLTAIDTAISDEDQALLLLTSLPSSYDNIVETLLYGIITRNLKVLSRMKIRYLVMELMGGSYHITYKRDYLVDFEEYEGANILLGDGRECRVWGQAFRKQLGEYQTGWKIKTGNVLDFCNQRNMGFNKSGEYKKTFIGSGVGTGSVQVLQGVEFEVEPQKDHTFEVEPHGNVNYVVGSQEVQTKGLIYYHSVRDKEQHSACELFSYREDSNEAAFVVVAVDKIYAHESLTFNNTVACEVIYRWKAGLKFDMDAQSDVYVLSNDCKKYKAKGHVLSLEIVRDQSGNTLRVSQSMFYNGKLVQTLLEGSLSGDYDVEKNDKRTGFCGFLTTPWEDQSLSWVDQSQAAYITLTEAAKEAIWLKGLAIESGFELKIVAGIATGALSKDIPGSRFQHRTFPVFGRAKDVTPCAILASLIVYPPPRSS